MHSKIKDFIAAHHLLSMGVQDSAGVHMASCFYAFDEARLALLIKSEASTKHLSLARECPDIGITIAPETSILKDIKGLQARAMLLLATEEQEGVYYARFPFARLGGGVVCALEIYWAKYTDNKLLSASKLEYRR